MANDDRATYEKIKSARNTLVREAERLQKSTRQRRERGLIVLEGETLVREALGTAIELETLVAAESLLAEPSKGLETLLHRAEERARRCVSLPDTVFRRISTLASPPGILVIAKRPGTRLSTFSIPDEGPLLVVNDVQDPGNLGSLARSAEAAGCSGMNRFRPERGPVLIQDASRIDG